MSKKAPEQFDLQFPPKSGADSQRRADDKGHVQELRARVFLLKELRRTKEHAEEGKYIRAILDLVRHYK